MKAHPMPERKSAAASSTESPSLASALQNRIRLLAETPTGRYGIPLIIFIVSLLLGGWTFDPKLSISGDNTEFITLARSLEQGKGLTYINVPDPTPATKYPFGFPLLLAPLERLFPGQWVPMKWLVVVLLSLGMPVFYWLVRQRLGVLPALVATLLCLTAGRTLQNSGPLLLDYGHQVMSEIPYMVFSLLALLLVEKGIRTPGVVRNYPLIGGFLATMCACYIRSIGLVLVAAMATYLLVRRDGRRALIFSGAALLTWLPWHLRNRAVGGGGTYFRQLLMVNPYRPELGFLDSTSLVERIVGNANIYLSFYLPVNLWPWSEGYPDVLNPLSLLVVGLMVYAAVLCLWRQQDLLLLIYAAFYLGTVLVWPWTGDRFLAPIVPVLAFFLVRLALDTVAHLKRWKAERIGLLLAWVLFFGILYGNVNNARHLAGLGRGEYADYLSAWRNYQEAGEWLRENTSTGSIIVCRKGIWMNIVSGRRCIGFPFDTPEAVIAHMEREKVDFVVVESLGFVQTMRFLLPTIARYPERFLVLWQRHDPPTHILRFLHE
jgi:hypothetical protein